MLTRRCSLLAGSAIAALVAGADPAAGPRRAPADKQAPGIYRYKIGAFELDRAL